MLSITMNSSLRYRFDMTIVLYIFFFYPDSLQTTANVAETGPLDRLSKLLACQPRCSETFPGAQDQPRAALHSKGLSVRGVPNITLQLAFASSE